MKYGFRNEACKICMPEFELSVRSLEVHPGCVQSVLVHSFSIQCV